MDEKHILSSTLLRGHGQFDGPQSQIGNGRVINAQPEARKPRRKIRVASLLMATAFATWLWYDRGIKYAPSDEGLCARPGLKSANAEFDWADIEPTSKLNWVKCFEDKECARFSVPLDWNDVDGEKAAIAMIKIPSAFPVGSKGYRGPVLFNPGGPGGSGVGLIHRFGTRFAKILGNDYDLIGFDPRGVGATTPPISLFASAAELERWNAQDALVPLINTTQDALARTYARGVLAGELSVSQGRSAGKVGKFVSTATVARDMLEITRAHGREKLLYWGFSYGSILGATYAAMFPNNIDRLVIDGVADSENYYATRWDNNLRDTSATLQSFYDACSASNSSSLCPLFEETPALVRERVDAILSSLASRPLAVRGPSNTSDYSVVDFAHVKNAIFGSLYKPFDTFERLAKALAALEKGDGSLILAFQPPDKLGNCECSGGKKGDKEAFNWPGDGTASTAIRCGDGDVVEDTLEELQEHYERLAKVSEFADGWASVRVVCAGWKVRGDWRFTGPFVGNTSFPLLVIGNTADPVTPLWAAHKMAKGYKDAVVLTQNSPGHCSLSGTSLCTQKAVREYFRYGHLPAPGTTCEIQDQLFAAPSNASDVNHYDLVASSMEETEMLEAVRSIREEWDVRFL